MWFEESRPDRKKKAMKLAGAERARQFLSSPIPPALSYEFFQPDELNYGGDRTLVFDVESYPNYFCVSFKCIATGKVVCFEITRHGYSINGLPMQLLDWTYQLNYILFRFRLIGFNSRTYDMPIVNVAVQGVDAQMLHQITEEIILQDMQAYEVERKYCSKIAHVNHIDLIEVAPLQASLKMYAGRLNCKRMQDLPFEPATHLTDEQAAIVRDYNINDLDNTQALFEHLLPSITLREELGKVYQCDLRSKSDAQIAETVIVSELQKLGIFAKSPDIETGTQFLYQVPDFIEFKTPQFQEVLRVVANTPFVVGTGGYADCPEEIEKLKPKLGMATYRLGAGGLHSSEESIAHIADENTLLIDRDVASYYPYIILNQGLAPTHLGEPFLKVYRSIVDRRLHAKRTKDKVTDQSLKITINGCFGKLGNRYSKIYSPDLLIQVTMTGQLSLLMLIEMIELVGIPVASANTDGIVIKCPKHRYSDLETIIIIWEEKTGFLTEETRYKGLYSRDVNNYIAIKEDGKCKTKGVYSEVGSALNSPLSKNPEGYICSLAVQAFLSEGTPVAETIDNCRDLTKFLSVRNVKGGAEKDGVYLGKSVRWYYAKGEKGAINYVLSGNKVPKSDGAKPCMILPDSFPDDIDFDWYVNEAEAMLYEIGYYRRAKTGSLF